MNISIQNINKNTNYTMIRTPKVIFRGYHLKPDAFMAEHEIAEKIRTMPDNIFKEQAEFLKFCKSIDITPKISSVIKNKLAEVWQAECKTTVGLRIKNRDFENYSKSKFLIFSISFGLPQFLS